MSHGPGAIERKIGDLFAASHDRALDIDEMVASAFDLSRGARPTRAMRISTVRAARRLIRRLDEIKARAAKLRDEAWRAVDAILPDTEANYSERHTLFEATPQWQAATRLFDECKRVGEKTRLSRKEGDRDRIYAETESWRATQLGRAAPPGSCSTCQTFPSRSSR
jgi:hypothetical protein